MYVTGHNVVDYSCPECGYDGPHTVMGTENDVITAECGSCYTEFDVDASNEE